MFADRWARAAGLWLPHRSLAGPWRFLPCSNCCPPPSCEGCTGSWENKTVWVDLPALTNNFYCAYCEDYEDTYAMSSSACAATSGTFAANCSTQNEVQAFQTVANETECNLHVSLQMSYLVFDWERGVWCDCTRGFEWYDRITAPETPLDHYLPFNRQTVSPNAPAVCGTACESEPRCDGTGTTAHLYES